MIMYGYRCVVGDFFHEAKNLRIDTRKGTNGPCVEGSFLDVPVSGVPSLVREKRQDACF